MRIKATINVVNKKAQMLFHGCATILCHSASIRITLVLPLLVNPVVLVNSIPIAQIIIE